jgi:hypothetical protein
VPPLAALRAIETTSILRCNPLFATKASQKERARVETVSASKRVFSILSRLEPWPFVHNTSNLVFDNPNLAQTAGPFAEGFAQENLA